MRKKTYVKKCPFCGGQYFRTYCTDWQDNHYSKCIECDFVFQDVYEKYDYSKEYWMDAIDPDGIKRDLTRERNFKVNNWYGGIIDYVNGLPNGKILDIGCGLGFLLSALDGHWEKVGFDVTDDCFKFIKKRFPEISLFSGTMDAIFDKYNEKSFDVVILYHVIEHIDKPVQFFDKTIKLLSKKGLLIVGTPNISSFCAKWFKGNYRLLGNGHLCMFTPTHLKKLFGRNNLEIVKEEYPFFKTSYFTINNLFRLINRRNVSPPFYGNIMTFYGLNTI